jgi:predicted nucleotidyltransferase
MRMPAQPTQFPMDPALVAAAKAFSVKISGRYDYTELVLFGSRAREDHRPDSDMDVAVLLRGMPGKFIATKLAMDDLAYDVLLDTGIRITPLPIWAEEWAHPENYSNPALIANIQREGIRL